MVAIILKVIWTTLTYLLKGIMLVGTYVAYPFVFCTGERRFIPFKTYGVTMNDPLYMALYKGLLYMGWGSLSFFYFRYFWFIYCCLTVFGHTILGYEKTIGHIVLLVVITLFLGGLYFFLIFTQSRQINSKRKLGNISIINTLGRMGILWVWISILVMPLFIEKELNKGEKLKDIAVVEENLISKVAEEKLSKVEIGFVEKWSLLEKYYADFYLKKEYKDLVIKYAKLFYLAFFIKILLLYLDIYYVARKKSEMKYVI